MADVYEKAWVDVLEPDDDLVPTPTEDAGEDVLAEQDADVNDDREETLSPTQQPTPTEDEFIHIIEDKQSDETNMPSLPKVWFFSLGATSSAPKMSTPDTQHQDQIQRTGLTPTEDDGGDVLAKHDADVNDDSEEALSPTQSPTPTEDAGIDIIENQQPHDNNVSSLPKVLDSSVGATSIAPKMSTPDPQLHDQIHRTGAGRAKREQLKRKGERLGVTADYFLKDYAQRKRAKKLARQSWREHGANDDDMPEDIRRSNPICHQPSSRKRSRKWHHSG